ncbi:hypothetical protein ACLKA7_002683 [Drosophila subpalustris]
MTRGSRTICDTQISFGTLITRVVSTTFGTVICLQRLTTIGSGTIFSVKTTRFLQIKRGGCCTVMHLGNGGGMRGAHCGRASNWAAL